MKFYVGTLTREGGPGIAACLLEDDVIRVVSCHTGITDPSYCILSADKKTLYAVSSDGDGDGFRGCVNRFSVGGSGMELVARQDFRGNGPCFLALSPDERFLYSANYHSGSVAVFPVDGGLLRPCVQLVSHRGSSVHPVRQASAHVHQVSFIPGTGTLCAVDLGEDRLHFYHQDSQTGMLTETGALACPEGSGPRHAAYGKNGALYLLHELRSSVSVLLPGGSLYETAQDISTLPAAGAGSNLAAAVRVSEDGKALFASNRGHGSITVFDVLADGTLAFTENFPAGKLPRDFVLLRDGRLLVADQAGAVLVIGPEHQIVSSCEIGAAVCVCV